MKLVDTTPYFLENFKQSLSFLNSYHKKYPEVFEYYFTYHCKNSLTRREQSLQKYPESLSDIRQVHEHIRPILTEIEARYQDLYGMNFPVNINLFIGCYGSNAYTHRQYIPDVSFSLERLSPNEDHLSVIVAHELGHAAHHILSDQQGIDWSNVKWESPALWIYQEGVATHLSRQIVPHLKPTTYFSYNDDGIDRLDFYNEHTARLIQSFSEDFQSMSPNALFKEWFSINGGHKHGYTRLAYYIGDSYFQDLIREVGEMEALVAWKRDDFLTHVNQWLMTKVV